MDVFSATLVAATLINAAENLWELTFNVEDDPADQRKYEFQSQYDFKNSRTQYYFLTVMDKKIVKLEPLE